MRILRYRVTRSYIGGARADQQGKTISSKNGELEAVFMFDRMIVRIQIIARELVRAANISAASRPGETQAIELDSVGILSRTARNSRGN